MTFNKLIEKYKKKRITVGIIGIGYVGLKLLLQFANKKVNVIGFDQDTNKLNLLKKNLSPISYINNSEIKKIKYFTSYESDYSKVDKSIYNKVIAKANLEEFIEDYQSRKNLKLGSKGIMVSGGEGQRISLARALYKNSELLFLFDFHKSTSLLFQANANA